MKKWKAFYKNIKNIIDLLLICYYNDSKEREENYEIYM